MIRLSLDTKWINKLMRLFSQLIPLIVVIFMLNGCLFSSKSVQRWNIEPSGTTSFALSRDGHFALLYSKKNQLELWDLNENKRLAELGKLDQQSSNVSKIRFSDNSQFAVTAGQTNFAVWNLAWSQAKGLWSISDGVIRDIDLSNDGHQILMGLSNGKAIYVDLVSGRRMEFLAHREKVNSVALSANGQFALTGGNDYIAYLWDTTTGQILRKFEHQQRINRVALQRDGKMAFTSDGGNQSFIWNLADGSKITALSSFSRQLIFSSARFSDDGSRLLTGTPSSQIMLWDTQSGKKLQQFEAEPLKDARPPRAVVYDAVFDQQQRVVAATSAGIAQAWEISD
jgi:WD40 repeat protein